MGIVAAVVVFLLVMVGKESCQAQSASASTLARASPKDERLGTLYLSSTALSASATATWLALHPSHLPHPTASPTTCRPRSAVRSRQSPRRLLPSAAKSKRRPLPPPLRGRTKPQWTSSCRQSSRTSRPQSHRPHLNTCQAPHQQAQLPRRLPLASSSSQPKMCNAALPACQSRISVMAKRQSFAPPRK